MLSRDILTEALHDMFELSPTAFCISTADNLGSRYLKVNPAYLALIGREWHEINQQTLIGSGSTRQNEARARRMALLETVGSYRLEEVDLQHAGGAIIPTLISAQRRMVGGEAIDIEIIIDHTERQRAQREFDRKLTEAAYSDYLTGLPNRASFDQELSGRLAVRSDVPSMTVLAFIDLNGFKAVNDRYGHAMGDHLLRGVARRLTIRFGAGDFVARLGGDEFAILVTCGPLEPRTVFNRISRLAVEVFAPLKKDQITIDIGAAIGIAAAAAGNSPEIVLQAADKLMYEAKLSAQMLAIRVQQVDEGRLVGAA